MNIKLRDAGFKAGDSLSKVAEKTGLDVAQVRVRAGLPASATVLDDAALDRGLPFPDGFVAAGTASMTTTDVTQVPRGGAGEGATRATVGGLLRAKLEQQLPVSSTSPVLLPTRGAFPNDAAFLRATKAALVDQAGMKTVDNVLALARAIEPGVQAWISGDDANALLNDLLHALRVSSNEIEQVTTRLDTALRASRPEGSGVGGPVTIDARTLPLDPTKHEFLARHVGALAKELVRQGLDTDAHVRTIARRMGLAAELVAAKPETALWHLLNDLGKRSDVDAMIAGLTQALATPLDPASARTVTIDPTVVPDATSAPFMGRLVADTLRALVDGGVDTLGLARALAARFGVAHEVSGDRAHAIVYAALSALRSQVGDDMNAFVNEVRMALAQGPLVEHVDAGLPSRVDTSALAAAAVKGDKRTVRDALLAIVDTPAKANELADRLEVRPHLVGPESSPLQTWTLELLNMVDVARVIDALA